MPDERSMGTAALDRGLRLLGGIVDDQARTPLRAIVEALGISYATGRRMAATLERQGFIARVGAGRYRPGPTMLRLRDSLDPRGFIIDVSRKPLRSLARQLGCTAHLGIWEGDMVTYLVKEPGGRSRLFTREGGQLEAYGSAIGKMLLAHLPAAERELFLGGGPFVALTDHTITDAAMLAEELRRIGRRGFATDRAEMAPDVHCVAVPVRSRRGIVAAISLSGHEPFTTASLKRRIAGLRAAGAAISLRLSAGRSPTRQAS